ATSVYNTPYTAFLGIPYAEPPTGELRFQAPRPAAAWEGVLNATQYGSDCVQSTGTGYEDCLYLNVYVPGTPAEAAALPVLFWIHGGEFGSGSGSDQQYGPHFIVSYGVILVTTNYRLGPLGFLSTGDEVVPGNAGLKDQQLALTWVQRNIANFGGDPDLVTPFGQSAGGMAVSFHLVSPLSAGVKHSGELPFLFLREDTEYNFDPVSEEEQVRRRVLRYWTNFAKYGNPTPAPDPMIWEPYDNSTRRYMLMQANFTLAYDKDAQRMGFWNENIVLLPYTDDLRGQKIEV
ncbi:acetylcholinesterase-like, partial [Schistocerca gregaria]|uniref:acetylcholinesterase-like n=1 Tax=Schistocerca gregaria TaxID=7010 RepID=UPI00211E3030